MIRNRQLVLFCPFVNKDYRNTWGNDLELEYGSVENYYAEKRKFFRDENFTIDKQTWWANGNIICNWESDQLDQPGCHYWGDQFLFQIKDMLAETCKHRDIPDCEFFINKRDYPQLKYHQDVNSTGYPVEPYGFIFDKDDRDPCQDIPLKHELYRTYAPILSFYTSQRFADIPLPPSEDWEAATGELFPVSFSYSVNNGEVEVQPPRELFTRSNLEKFNCSWENKKPTAFFRGTATGGGITIDTNQRLHLAYLSQLWEKRDGDDPKLDAKITGWNPRDKKIASAKMNFVKPSEFPFKGGKENFVEIYKQSSYKYLIYAEGHCAACRYAFMMLLGSVILKVKSRCVADQLWYFPMLQPWVDHVPVAEDLSDLEEKIDWCRNNDDKCKEIAVNARALYDKYISKDGILGTLCFETRTDIVIILSLDYLQDVFVSISKKWLYTPSWADDVPQARTIPTKSGGVGTIAQCCHVIFYTLSKDCENNADRRVYADSARNSTGERRLRLKRELSDYPLKRAFNIVLGNFNQTPWSMTTLR